MDFEKLDKSRPIHMTGIGGSAMSGLARILRGRGFEVAGTDLGAAESTIDALAADGIRVDRVQDGSAMDPSAQLVIATAAIPEGNAELEAAHRRGIPVVKYAAALGALVASSQGIAVAGTHGKTTTTALVAHTLRFVGDDVGFIVGGHVPQLLGSAGDGASPRFVVEACEYDRSFLNLSPSAAIVTNIEADHLDVYADMESIEEAFAAFVSRIRPGGVLVYNADCARTRRVATCAACERISCSIDHDADFRARRVELLGDVTRFEIATTGGLSIPVTLFLPGLHNVLNATLAIALGARLHADPSGLARAAGTFTGVSRRFELKGESGGVAVLDDYAHHPTEIAALVSAARQRYPGRRLVIAFQPHQLSRTRSLFDGFHGALAKADLVLIADVFAARDEGSEAGAAALLSERLAAAIASHGTRALHVHGLDGLARRAADLLAPGDVFVTVGAGDVHRAAGELLALL